MARFERILFPVDFSERSRAAAPFVLSMAQRYKSQVRILHVLQPPPPLYAGMNTVYPETYDFDGIAADLRVELQKFAEAELPKVDVACAVVLPRTRTTRRGRGRPTDVDSRRCRDDNRRAAGCAAAPASRR